MARGCFLFALPGRASAALPGVSLRAPPAGVHAADRARVAAARRAAEGAIAAIGVSGASPEVAGAVASKVAAVWAGAADLAVALGRGRTFLEEFAPDQLARKRAELEIRALEVSASELRAIDQERAAQEALAERASEVRGDVAVLQARLEAVIATLEALRGSAERIAVGGAGLLDELEAEEAEAKRALDAFGRTMSELAR